MAPFTLSVADLSGTERPLMTSDDLDHLMRERDRRRAESNPASRYFRVTDDDDAERGEAEWCETCGMHGAFGESINCCAVCRGEEGLDD